MKKILKSVVILAAISGSLLPEPGSAAANRISGQYKGTGSVVVKQCAFPRGVSRKQPFKANITFSDTAESLFIASGVFKTKIASSRFLLDVDLSGSISNTGTIEGRMTFNTYIDGGWQSYSEGPFTGKLKGKQITIKGSAADLRGDNCIYKETMLLKRVKRL